MKTTNTRSRIIATIGPRNANIDSIRELSAAGMSIARLNGSHNTLDWHSATIRTIQTALPELPILLDIPGRKIRTALIDEPLAFDKNELITLTTDSSHATEKIIAVSFEKLHDFLKPSQIVFADDGTLKFVVERIDGREIILRSLMAGKLGSRKGINVPGVDLGPVLVTPKDKAMIEFAINHKIFSILSKKLN